MSTEFFAVTLHSTEMSKVPRFELFAERLRQAMDAKGWTQVRLASEVKVNKTSVTHWLGGSIPSIERVVAIARALDQDWLWLIGADASVGVRVSGKRPRPAVDIRALQSLAKKLEAVAADARRVAGLIPEE